MQVDEVLDDGKLIFNLNPISDYNLSGSQSPVQSDDFDEDPMEAGIRAGQEAVKEAEREAAEEAKRRVAEQAERKAAEKAEKKTKRLLKKRKKRLEKE